MQKKSFDKMACGIARALDAIGDWWTLLIIREALFGARTFEEFCDNLGIARNTLTTRLNDLVDKGILDRADDPTDGRRKIYTPTPAGQDLWIVLAALQQWGNNWVFGEDAAPSFMADRKTETPIAPLTIRNRKDRPLSLEDVTMIAGPGATKKLKQKFAKLEIPR